MRPARTLKWDRLLFRHPYFSYEYTFVRAEQGRAVAFICGCVGNDITHGRERGCFTCLAADPAWDTPETTVQLLDALEEAFRVAGKTASAVTFFNPMHLPWVIPGSPGHEHNNMPGIATDLPLHERMLAHGYTETTQETAMYRTLTDFAIPPEVRALEHRTAAEGCTLALYDPNRHHGLDAMLQALDNPDWTVRVTAAARDGLSAWWLWQEHGGRFRRPGLPGAYRPGLLCGHRHRAAVPAPPPGQAAFLSPV